MVTTTVFVFLKSIQENALSGTTALQQLQPNRNYSKYSPTGTTATTALQWHAMLEQIAK
jgi:hypothetical protein